MTEPSSQSAYNRVSGKHQVDEQRIAILEAAEKLFLELGIEKTRMIDIAERAGITRVTLYRYFANRDEVAVAVHLRFRQKTEHLLQLGPMDHSLESHKRRTQAMIRNFAALHDMYRFTGMFDRIYLDNTPDTALTRWTLDQLMMSGLKPPSGREREPKEPYREEIKVIINTVIWFLQKLALRGELTWSDKETPMQEHLRVFEELIVGYFDRLIEARDSKNLTPRSSAALPSPSQERR
jgi:AcrR family transcriptional regulator